MHKYEGMVSCYQHHFANKLTTMLLVVVKARVTMIPESVLHYSIPALSGKYNHTCSQLQFCGVRSGHARLSQILGIVTHKKQGRKQSSSISPLAHPLYTVVVVAASQQVHDIASAWTYQAGWNGRLSVQCRNVLIHAFLMLCTSGS